MNVVIDTNVLVSAFWSKNGIPAQIIGMVITGKLILCYDYRILEEYRNVLKRPKFCFSASEINFVLDYIEKNGISVIAPYLNDDFIDNDDKKFYEVAKYCQCLLITGNKKHFPIDADIMSPTDFIAAI